MTNRIPDTISTRSGAEANAKRLQDYWAAKGFRIRTWVEVGKASRDSAYLYFWNVRSDLVKGLPRDFTL